ncbi:MAG TPA: GNAT family N-acetyltransferase [Bacillota bacterium]|jgi:ribosomal protein S18 acetylase RimI-like enzyme|nr:GNAT family N-acetyltransferase [Bacillota bacterium]HOL11164.1 GNAT family N-acetyltransferase [Bacillota bacterium]
MIQECNIRHANINDLDNLIPLLKLLFAIEADFSFDEAKQRRGLELMLERPNERCIMVAEVNNEIIGMCTAQLVITTAEGGTAALIEDVVIKEEYRGQGIGRQMMNALEAWAWQKGVKRLQLLADRSNTPALEFYKRLNWNRTQLICLHKKER